MHNIFINPVTIYFREKQHAPHQAIQNRINACKLMKFYYIGKKNNSFIKKSQHS